MEGRYAAPLDGNIVGVEVVSVASRYCKGVAIIGISISHKCGLNAKV